MKLLKEMQVIEAIVRYLNETKHFDINHVVKKTTEHGTDIVATSPLTKTILKIEAKGQTSSRAPKKGKKGSNRYGSEFDGNQKQDHIGRALLKCMGYLNDGFAAGIGLPGDPYDGRLVKSISTPLTKLGVVVFFVTENRVMTFGDLPK